MHYLPHTIPDEADSALMPAAFCSDAAEVEEWIKSCKADRAQLWREGDFWMVTEITKLREGIALHIVAAAGEYTPALVSEAESWARSIGCSKSFFTGRKGWARRVPEYRLRTVTLEKEL